MADAKVTQRKSYDPAVARQDQQETLDKNIPFPWRKGKLITGIEMNPSSSRRISHGLGHQHSGWILVRPRATSGANVFEVQTEASRTTFTLATTASITFDLWVW